MPVKALATALVLGLTALVPTAAADSRVGLSRGVLTFVSEDVGLANRLTVEDGPRGRVRLFEPVDPFGMRLASAPCDPGRLNEQANIVELFCARPGIARLRVDIGDGEDVVVVRTTAWPVTLDGGLGADRLRTAAGADAVTGGQGQDIVDAGAGADRLVGGPGADRLAAGAGDDGVQSADGEADTVDCGPGFDTVLADTTDALSACENITRQAVAPAGTPPREDATAPTLRLRAPSRRRVTARRAVVTVTARVDEPALVRASGFVSAGGLRSRVRIASADLDRAGASGALRIRLSRTQARRVAADLRRGRRPSLRLTVSAVDPAGNTSAPRRLTIRLVR